MRTSAGEDALPLAAYCFAFEAGGDGAAEVLVGAGEELIEGRVGVVGDGGGALLAHFVTAGRAGSSVLR